MGAQGNLCTCTREDGLEGDDYTQLVKDRMILLLFAFFFKSCFFSAYRTYLILYE